MTEIPSDVGNDATSAATNRKSERAKLGVVSGLRRSYGSAGYFRLARPFQRQRQALANAHT